MASIASPFTTQQIDFEVDYHRTMAAVLATCKAVKNHSWMVLLAKDIWGASRDFKALLIQLESLRVASAADIRSILPKLQHLGSTCNRFIDTATKAGLRNRTFTGAPLHSFIVCAEKLYEITETLSLSVDPAIAESVREAVEEYERGETVNLDSLV